MSLLGVHFISWQIYESILLILNILTFFILCFHWFHGNTPLKYCFYSSYQKILISLYTICLSKKIHFDKSKFYSITNFPIALLVMNCIEMLLLNNQCLSKICDIFLFSKTCWFYSFLCNISNFASGATILSRQINHEVKNTLWLLHFF